ncbi:MAG: hypothetical protein ACR2MQ_06590 [Gemmatimonadaceae bacterium]
MRRFLASIALSAAVLVPAAASAQQSITPIQPTSHQTALAAPKAMIHPDVAGVQADHKADAPLKVSSAAAAGGLHQGEGIALMAVGGAGLIAGLLVGGNAGTAVAIGGLAVGLVGLYQYVL